GRDRRARVLDERKILVAHRLDAAHRALVRERLHVLADRGVRIRLARIDETKDDALRRERPLDALDLRRIAVRDGTVDAGKDVDDGLGSGRLLQRVERRRVERMDKNRQREEHEETITKKGLRVFDPEPSALTLS